ncbi:hypothetical protein [Mycoplasma parvum]|uniref:Uncharacterized protein n=1 Tax=Mycoplasma parvum str. Indiana TaxID=1403316 RepID=U5NFJ3_9MOLU|nr:hypothetical protein [Mycoplasma parvum]AGX88998.1 hypothetical protein PRV_01180 [Mycoplasma parvum str. Indiana]
MSYIDFSKYLISGFSNLPKIFTTLLFKAKEEQFYQKAGSSSDISRVSSKLSLDGKKFSHLDRGTRISKKQKFI